MERGGIPEILQGDENWRVGRGLETCRGGDPTEEGRGVARDENYTGGIE